MANHEEFSDPFGAPELYVDGVAYREMIGPDLMRTAFYAGEQGSRIIRIKLLIPASVCASAHQDLHNWLRITQGIKLAS